MGRKKRDENSAPPDDGPDLDLGWISRIREKLTAWYREAKREFPWRETSDPYRVLVSEVMLVQTTTAAAVPYYSRFLERFPTIRDLASANEEEVLKAWEGLGYYRRARQLHEAARIIDREHQGEVPSDPEELAKLPGLGRYIVGAVLSFAFDRRAPILEANTRRVAARWLAWEPELGSTESEGRLWRAAERLVPDHSPGEFNQAFMELGSLVCLPRSPNCLICPVAGDCRSRSLGLQDEIPALPEKAAPLEVEEACALVLKSGKILAVRRSKSGLWENFWEFPAVNLSGADPASRSRTNRDDLSAGFRRCSGVSLTVGPRIDDVRYTVTKHRVSMAVYRATFVSGEPEPGPGLDQAAWVPVEELEALTMGSPFRKLATKLRRGGYAFD